MAPVKNAHFRQSAEHKYVKKEINSSIVLVPSCSDDLCWYEIDSVHYSPGTLGKNLIFSLQPGRTNREDAE